MGFLPVPSDAELSHDAVAARNRFADEHPGPLSPLDRALLNNVTVFEAYTRWFDVKDELEALVGERAVTLFSLALSRAVPAPYPTAFFEGELRNGGDDPDNPQVTEAETLLLEWGRAVGADPSRVPADLVARVEQTFKPASRAVLAGYAGLMFAVCIFSLVAGLEPEATTQL
ncbi:MAG: hypothetical protein WBL06_13100 [Pseudolysinimonas sp.]|jgi:hypothetical protein|uniref:hypothetical protein n=1 Tax=Pseudolysinimonas sp. TaxID=2680009 RepID=UPI003C767DE6